MIWCNLHFFILRKRLHSAISTNDWLFLLAKSLYDLYTTMLSIQELSRDLGTDLDGIRCSVLCQKVRTSWTLWRSSGSAFLLISLSYQLKFQQHFPPPSPHTYNTYITVSHLEKITIQISIPTPLRGTIYHILLFCWWPYFGHKNNSTHALELLLEILLLKLESLQITLFNTLIWVRG